MPHALLVDDDSDAAETMAMLIANEGFTVATAGSLRDARRQMALQEPDIVLLDLTGLTTLADAFVICSGGSERQLDAIADGIIASGR